MNIDKLDINDESNWQWHLSFIGQYMQHNYYLHYIIDKVIMANDKLSSIIEIGTGCGALSIVLGLWGCKRGIPIFTFDIELYKCLPVIGIFNALDITFTAGDIFSDGVKNTIHSVALWGPSLLICDGGDKKKEFNTFVPFFKSGSIICIHDWEHECYMEDIQETVDRYCEPVMSELWDKMNVAFSIWRKK
jgi:hypothetical protein